MWAPATATQAYHVPNKMAIILQTTFSWQKIVSFQFKFNWCLFLRIQFKLTQHYYRYWFGAESYLQRLVLHVQLSFVPPSQALLYPFVHHSNPCRCSGCNHIPTSVSGGHPVLPGHTLLVELPDGVFGVSSPFQLGCRSVRKVIRPSKINILSSGHSGSRHFRIHFLE